MFDLLIASKAFSFCAVGSIIVASDPAIIPITATTNIASINVKPDLIFEGVSIKGILIGVIKC